MYHSIRRLLSLNLLGYIAEMSQNLLYDRGGSYMKRVILSSVQKYNIYTTAFVSIEDRSAILASINTRDLMKNMVRVKSSNVWSYAMNIRNRKDKFGDVLVQFKNKAGGPGDVYIYYDVPILLYRRWQSAPSKGHFFWVYIRNNFKYSKLTGNKRGVLPNAVNH